MIWSEDNSSITVEVELWENQNFWPMKGWSNPYFGVPHFVVHFAEASIHAKEFPAIALPAGWVWVDDQWKVDTSPIHGNCDAEGWVYGATFDTIHRSILSSTTVGVATQFAMARKRKFKRKMRTNSPPVMSAISERVKEIMLDRKRIGNYIVDKQKIFDDFLTYEDKRFDSDLATHESILKPVASIKERFNRERTILLAVRHLLVGVPESELFIQDIVGYFENVHEFLDDCSQEYAECNDNWVLLNEDIQFLIQHMKKTLDTLTDNHVDEIALLSEELSFLRGAGSIGQLLPSGSRLLTATKQRKRKLSWDIPEYGCLWYNLKTYHRLVISVKQLMRRNMKNILTLFERQVAYQTRLKSLLDKLNSLFPTIHEKLMSNADVVKTLSTNYFTAEEVIATFKNIHFFIEDRNLIRLPSTLGKFTLMIASSQHVKQSRLNNCTPTALLNSTYRAGQDVLGKDNGSVVVDGVQWTEVMIAISTDGFMHLLSTTDDYETQVPWRSVALKGSVVRTASTAVARLDNCVEIKPFVPSLGYFLYYRLLGHKLSRGDDGVVLCVDDKRLAATLIELLSGHFPIFGQQQQEDGEEEDGDVDEKDPEASVEERRRKLPSSQSLQSRQSNKNSSQKNSTRQFDSIAEMQEGDVDEGEEKEARVIQETSSGNSNNNNAMQQVYQKEINSTLARFSRALSIKRFSSFQFKNNNNNNNNNNNSVKAAIDNSNNSDGSSELDSLEDVEGFLSRKRADSTRLDSRTVSTLTTQMQRLSSLRQLQQQQQQEDEAETREQEIGKATALTTSSSTRTPPQYEAAANSNNKGTLLSSFRRGNKGNDNNNNNDGELDVFPARYRIGKRSISPALVNNNNGRSLPYYRLESEAVKQYVSGVKESWDKEDSRRRQIKDGVSDELARSVTPNVRLEKTSEAFRHKTPPPSSQQQQQQQQQQPRARSAQLSRSEASASLRLSTTTTTEVISSLTNGDTGKRSDSSTQIRRSVKTTTTTATATTTKSTAPPATTVRSSLSKAPTTATVTTATVTTATTKDVKKR